MGGLDYGKKYLLSTELKKRKEGITEYNGKFIVRIRTKPNVVKTLAQFKTEKEANEFYNNYLENEK